MSRGRGPFQRGLEAYAKGAWEAAELAFQEVLASTPDSAAAHDALGLARMKSGNLAGARAALLRAEELDPSAEAAFHRGLIEQAAEHHSQALEAFERAGDRGYPAGEVTIARAACLALLGEPREARDALDELDDEDRARPEARYWDAVACAQERDLPGLRERAMVGLQLVLGAAEGVDDWLRGRAHFLLASLLDDSQDGYAKSVEHYLEGLAYDPDFVPGRNNLGAVYQSMGMADDARRELLQALRTNPGYRRVHGNLANLYYDKLSTESLRQDLADLARELDPEDLGEAVFGLVVALMDESRGRAYVDFYDRGHSLKNLLALMGSRLKRMRRRPPEGEQLTAKLASLQEQYDEIFERLAGDLRLVQPNRGPAQRIGINAVARRAASRAQRECAELEITLELQRELPALYGDAEAFTEALVNLLRNAAEAMDGTGAMTLSTRLMAAGDAIEVEVRDAGPGLPVGATEAIFKGGFTTKSQGSGVGLALVRRTMNDMRGSVSASNHPEGGAVFVMRVPVDVLYDPAKGLGLAARPVRLDDWDTLNVDELA